MIGPVIVAAIVLLLPGGVIAACLVGAFARAGRKRLWWITAWSLISPAIVIGIGVGVLVALRGTGVIGAVLGRGPMEIAATAAVFIGGVVAGAGYGLLSESRAVFRAGVRAAAYCAPLCLLSLPDPSGTWGAWLWLGACFAWLIVFLCALENWAEDERALRVHLCPTCEYDLRGPAPGASRRPECGAPVP